MAGSSRITLPCVQLISSRSVQALLDQRRAVDRQLDADHQARTAAPRGRCGSSLDQRFEPLAEQLAELRRPARAARRLRSFRSWRCRPRAAIGLPPNVAACMPGPQAGGDLGRGQQRRAGDAAAQALGQRHDVGLDAEVLIGEPLARAAAAGLHFVEDQQQARARRPICRSPCKKAGGRNADAAFALDRLDQDRARLVVDELARRRPGRRTARRRSPAAAGRALRDTSAGPWRVTAP